MDHVGGALASNGGSGLAVGTPGEDFLLPNEQGAGLVHVFGRSGAGNALNTVTDRTQNDFLGECGAFDGNELNEFWGSDLVFGQVSASAPSLMVHGQLESFGGVAYAGRVTVMFGAAAGCFDQGTSGVSGAPEASDYFGGALATGDFDGDGYADLAVGVPGEDLGSPVVGDAGGVDVLYGSSSGLTASGDQFLSQEVLTGTPASLNPADEFGSALATGDFDGDGHEDLGDRRAGRGDRHGRRGRPGARRLRQRERPDHDRQSGLLVGHSLGHARQRRRGRPLRVPPRRPGTSTATASRTSRSACRTRT